jgi:hypothetical protein
MSKNSKKLVLKPVAHNVDYDLVDGEEEEEVDLYEILSRKGNESPTIDANRSLYFLTHDELERLRGEVKAETTPGAVFSIIGILFEILALEREPEAYQDAVNVLSKLLDAF